MAKMTISGLDEFEAKLSKLEQGGVRGAAKMAIYDGAGELADAVRSGIESIPSISDKEAMKRYWKKQLSQITHTQKQGLVNGLGIATMRDSGGTIETHIGFDGYNEVHTKRWPNGQPNSMIARSVESGTSFMQKTPFLRTAVNRAKSSALRKMQETFEKRIDEIGG